MLAAHDSIGSRKKDRCGVRSEWMSSEMPSRRRKARTDDFRLQVIASRDLNRRKHNPAGHRVGLSPKRNKRRVKDLANLL